MSGPGSIAGGGEEGTCLGDPLWPPVVEGVARRQRQHQVQAAEAPPVSAGVLQPPRLGERGRGQLGVLLHRREQTQPAEGGGAQLLARLNDGGQRTGQQREALGHAHAAEPERRHRVADVEREW